jgi:hypothetical protein
MNKPAAIYARMSSDRQKEKQTIARMPAQSANMQPKKIRRFSTRLE